MHLSGGRLLAAGLSVLFALAFVDGTAADGRHTVRPGDTLSGIASIYGVTVQLLAEVNGIANPDLIFPGDILGIPGGGSDPSGDQTYEVKAGDTLSRIAERFDVAVEAIAIANGLTDANYIYIGQLLVIPGNESDPAAGLPARPPDDRQTETILNEMADAHGLDRGYVKAIAYVESGWNQGAVSSAGAMGVMQIMPDTAAWLESAVFGYPLNEDVSVYDNIKMGCRYLRILLDESNGSWDLAISSYYQGHGTTSSGIYYRDTQGYLRTVTAVKERYWP